MLKDLVILQGKTFSLPIRWETTPIVYKAITAMSGTAPLRITCTGHGMPDGWRVAVVAVKGMDELNAEGNPPKDKDFHVATYVDANTVELNAISAASFKPYVSGGYLCYNTPMDLTGYSARMDIKDKVGGTVLFSMLSTAPEITIDAVLCAVTLTISAVDTAAFDWKKGVYELELESPTGVVTSVLSGKVSVIYEVTT